GGLGMGFTLRAALDALPPTANVTVVELVPELVAWNQGPLAALARRPLDDRRVRVVVGDVGAAIARARALDAILLDVDNGPEALTAPGNASLYGAGGLLRAHRALAEGGVLGLWSAFDAPGFSRRLRAAGFDARFEKVHAHA